MLFWDNPLVYNSNIVTFFDHTQRRMHDVKTMSREVWMLHRLKSFGRSDLCTDTVAATGSIGKRASKSVTVLALIT